jgi:quinol monooxygenase YgiN
MIVVTGTLEMETEDSVRMQRASTAVAQATRLEPGCLTYAFWQSVEHPTVYRVYEEWQDKAALQAHFQTPHMATFRAELAEIGLLRRHVVCIEPAEITEL